MVDLEPMPARNFHHQVGALGRSAHAQHGVAVAEQALRNRVENLVEGFVADALAELCEREAATVEIDEAEFEKYNEWVQERLGRTVWGDVRNYFQSGSGRIVSQWPENVSTYIQKVDEAKREALRFDGHRDR